MDTIREVIIQQFLARLAVITKAGGYATNVGTHVYRARKKLDPSDLPAAVVFAGAETSENKYGQHACKMTVKIEGLAAFGAEDPGIITERVLGDIKKCVMAPGWTRTPDYIDSMIYTGGGVDDYPEDGQVSAGAYASFDVTYATKTDDPCSQ